MYSKKLLLFCCSLLLLNLSYFPVSAADGYADTSFSAGNLFSNDVYAILVQPDGKVLVAGDFFGPARSGIARLNSDGSLDTTFAETGASQVRSMALQPDGKVLIGGYFTTISGSPRTRIARLNTDGSLDTTFNPGNGAVGFDNPLVKAISVQPDGKILIGGNFETINNVQRRNIARLNTDGSVDTSFNAGVVLGSSASQVNIITLQANNQILVGGYFNTIGGGTPGSLARLNPDGTIDSTFKVGAGASLGVDAIKIQPDEKILISGWFISFNGVTRNKLARINPDGSLDTSFVSNVDDTTIQVYDFALLPNGKIVIVGNFGSVGGELCNRVCRLNPDGRIDRSFKSGTDSPIDYVFTIALQKDNKVLIGGTFSGVRGLVRRKIARLVNSETADFDGDDKTDISIFRRVVGEWWYLRSSDNGNQAFQFGNISSEIVPADYTGDGKTDIAFWSRQTGEWFILRSEDSSFYSFPFGITGDIPTSADFDRDGRADPAIFRPSTATWYILRSTGGTTIQRFGAKDDVVVPSDYDGDGKADLAIFRRSVGEWWYLRSSDGANRAFQFGSNSDHIVPADYTGDGRTDIAFWRPSSGEWFVLRSEDGSFYSAPFGRLGDIPVPGDYDGDGKSDFAVWRATDKNWYVAKSAGGFSITQFGAEGDEPVPTSSVKESTTFNVN
jgi:uncharacterized delta-60 repeat protein